MAVFDDDATYVEVGGSQVHGREALDSLEAANFRAIRLLDGSHHVLAVHLVGKYAYEIGEASGSTQAPGQAPVTYGPVPYMASWRRGADHQWRVHFMVVYP
jgi:ketosteroid isomerase-like protein